MGEPAESLRVVDPSEPAVEKITKVELKRRARVRRQLDRFSEFARVPEESAEAYIIADCIDTMETSPNTVSAGRARSELIEYQRKWSVASSDTIVIRFGAGGGGNG